MKKLFFLLIFIPFKLHAASIGPIFPSTCSNSAFSGGGDWTSPSNGLVEDGVNATNANAGSNYLYCSGYNFKFPLNSTITGIVLGVKKVDLLNKGVVDSSVTLFKVGLSAGNDKEDGVTAWPAALAYVSYGSATDTWGLNLTPNDVSNILFGAGISGIKNSGGTTSYGIDAEQMTVYFTQPTTIYKGTIYNGSLR